MGMERQWEQHYASHYHWIQLHFYPGLLAKLIKKKKADNRVTFSLTAHRNSEISLSDSVWNVTDVFSGSWRSYCCCLWQEVILSYHLVTPRCSCLRTFSHNSPLTVPSFLVFLGRFSNLNIKRANTYQMLRDHIIHTYIYITFNFTSVVIIS